MDLLSVILYALIMPFICTKWAILDMFLPFIYIVVVEVTIPLIHYIIVILSVLLVSFCLLMRPALKSVPTEDSFKEWILQLSKLQLECNGDKSSNSLWENIKNNVTKTLGAYLWVNNYKITFFSLGFIRLAICSNKENVVERHIFVGIFNTWIPTNF